MDRFKTVLSIALFSLLVNMSTWAQGPSRSCATMDHLETQKQKDPTLEFRMQNLEKATGNLLNELQTNAVSGVITIPVVVHVLYNTNAENISDEQILSQIEILNEDFRRTNSDADDVWPQAADTEIEFCLASRDPNGNFTTGITRTPTYRTSFTLDDAMKFDILGGKDAWPAGSYLNIWVCDLSGFLGYAQFPGGDPATDGVVCTYTAFGNTGTASSPFDLGRTTTHEVGHWLHLRHIWGDGDCSYDDFIADTPLSDQENYGCAIGHVSCGSIDMVQNYMDYSDDACMNLFTEGQRDRMRAIFEPGFPRESLLSSIGCQTPPTPNLGLAAGFGALQVNGTNVNISLRVINNGDALAGPSTVRYYLSTDLNFASTVFEIGSDQVGSLVPGATSDQNLSLDAGALSLPSGFYYVAFVIDADDEVLESNENDNGFYLDNPQVSVSGGGTPNLTQVAGVATLNVTGTNISASMRIQNNGTAAAGLSTIRYYLSTNATISASDYPIGSNAVGTLGPGNTSDQSISVDVGNLGIPPGTYYVGFIIDAANAVNESNEADNNGFWNSPQVTIPVNFPNLTLDTETATLDIDGTNLSATIRVINDGNSVAGVSTVRYYLSDNTTISTTDYEIGSDQISPLTSGSNSDKSIAVDVSAFGLPPGTYYFGFIIDADQFVNESDENDNVWYWSDPQVTISELVDCQGDDLVQTETFTAGSHVFRAANSISATDMVLSDVMVQYYAGSTISFLPGTHFQAGSSVLATIENCNPSTLQAGVPIVDEQMLPQEPAKAFTKVQHISLQAFPNPVSSRATIEYSLPEQGPVCLYLFDLLGKPLRILEQDAIKDGGKHRLELDVSALSPGTYLVVLLAGDQRKNIRITVFH